MLNLGVGQYLLASSSVTGSLEVWVLCTDLDCVDRACLANRREATFLLMYPIQY